jgi:hypothetical protein
MIACANASGITVQKILRDCPPGPQRRRHFDDMTCIVGILPTYIYSELGLTQPV